MNSSAILVTWPGSPSPDSVGGTANASSSMDSGWRHFTSHGFQGRARLPENRLSPVAGARDRRSWAVRLVALKGYLTQGLELLFGTRDLETFGVLIERFSCRVFLAADEIGDVGRHKCLIHTERFQCENGCPIPPGFFSKATD